MMKDEDQHDPIPRGRTQTIQATTIALLLVGLLTAIFVLQNTEETDVEFLAWSVAVPLGGALLLAAVLGGIFAFLVAFVRQRQMRKAARRERARHRD